MWKQYADIRSRFADKSSSSSTRSTVASVFNRVASECGSTTSGVARYYCSDVYGACSSNVLAVSD